MKIIVKILPRNVMQEVEVEHGTTVLELLRKIHGISGPVVVLKNNVPISVDYILNDDAELSILSVISGG
jgi:sulfur carrier protein ThiS